MRHRYFMKQLLLFFLISSGALVAMKEPDHRKKSLTLSVRIAGVSNKLDFDESSLNQKLIKTLNVWPKKQRPSVQSVNFFAPQSNAPDQSNISNESGEEAEEDLTEPLNESLSIAQEIIEVAYAPYKNQSWREYYFEETKNVREIIKGTCYLSAVIGINWFIFSNNTFCEGIRGHLKNSLQNIDPLKLGGILCSGFLLKQSLSSLNQGGAPTRNFLAKCSYHINELQKMKVS